MDERQPSSDERLLDTPSGGNRANDHVPVCQAASLTDWHTGHQGAVTAVNDAGKLEKPSAIFPLDTHLTHLTPPDRCFFIN